MLPDTFPWWGLLALATAAFTDVVTDLLPAGLLPQMSSSLHVPEARVGLLVSAFAIASALAAIPGHRPAARPAPPPGADLGAGWLRAARRRHRGVRLVSADLPGPAAGRRHGWHAVVDAGRLRGADASRPPARPGHRGRPGRHHRRAERRHPRRDGAVGRARMAGQPRPAGGAGPAGDGLEAVA